MILGLVVVITLGTYTGHKTAAFLVGNAAASDTNNGFSNGLIVSGISEEK